MKRHDLSEHDKKEVDTFERYMKGEMTDAERSEYEIPTREIAITFKIPEFLFPSWKELYRKTNPTLSQDAAMLLFFIKKQLNEEIG